MASHEHMSGSPSDFPSKTNLSLGIRGPNSYASSLVWTADEAGNAVKFPELSSREIGSSPALPSPRQRVIEKSILLKFVARTISGSRPPDSQFLPSPEQEASFCDCRSACSAFCEREHVGVGMPRAGQTAPTSGGCWIGRVRDACSPKCATAAFTIPPPASANCRCRWMRAKLYDRVIIHTLAPLSATRHPLAVGVEL